MKQNSRSPQAAWGVRIAGGTAMLAGAFGLAAWLNGRAAKWSPAGVISVNINMTVGLLLAGVALLLLGQSVPNRWRRALAFAPALIVLLAGVLTLGEHLLSYDLGIDQLLAAEPPGAAAAAGPNRISLFGTICLAFLGTGLVALAWGKRRLPPYLGLAVCVISLILAVGWLFGGEELFGLSSLTGIAWPTVAGLLALGAGLVMAVTESGPMRLLRGEDAGGALLRKMLPAVILVPLALGYLSLQARSRGLVGSAMDAGVLTVAMILIFAFFLWRTAVRLSRSAAAEAEANQAVRASEAELRKSRQKYQDLIETTSDFIWEMDAGGRYTYCSPQMEKLWGIKPEDMIGKTPFDLVPAEHRNGAATSFGGLASSPRPFSGLEAPSYDGRGRLITIEISGVPFFDDDGRLLGFRGISRDVTERKRAEQALRESEEHHRRLFDTMLMGVVYQSADGTVVSMNPAAERILGKSPAEFLGETSVSVEHDTLREDGTPFPGMEHPVMVALRTGEQVRDVVMAVFNPRERQYRWININAIPLFRKGESKPHQAYTIFEDITERKRIEARLKADLAALTRMHELSERLLDAAGLQPLLQEVMDAAVAIAAADRGTLQLVEGDSLRIVAHHGHRQPFLDFFAAAENCASVCGEAMRRGERVVVPDVESSPLFAGTPSLAVLREAGVRAVQSTPMVTRSGKLVGMLTTHWGVPHSPDEHDLWRVDLLVRQATDLIEHTRAEAALRESVARQKVAEAVEVERRRLFDVLETLPAMVCLLTPDYHVAFANRSFREKFGESRGQRCYEYCFGLSAPCEFCQTYSVLKTGRPHQWEVNAPDGTVIEAHDFPFTDVEGGSLILEMDIDITERRKTEAVLRDLNATLERRVLERTQELQDSENRFRILTENLQSAVALIDEQGRFSIVNPSFLRLFDIAAGADIMNINSRDWGQWQVFDEQGVLLGVDEHPVRQAAITGRPVKEKLVAVRSPSSQELRWMLISAEPILDDRGAVHRLICTYHDITERKKAEALVRALAEQERLRLGAAVEQASDSVVMVDLDGKIQYVNAAFESINSTPRDRAVGASYWELLADEALVGSIRESVRRGEGWNGHVLRPVSGGRPVELEVTVSPATDLAGRVSGALITEKDVTRENALQQQVRQAQKMEALGTLAGGITHDFNNILGTIILNTEMALLDLDPSHPARWPLPLVLQAANRGKELVKQIITFSRQRAWERKPLEIAPVVREGMRFLRSTLPKEISILETIDAGSGVILADPSHIHQILVNLCQNAALAMPDKPGQIEVKVEPVEADADMAARHPDLKPGPYVRLTVYDNGCGMSPEVMERIFDPFFTTRKHGQGSGLGLAVVHGIVKSYEGAISVYSEPGKGSTFSIFIPRLEGEALAQGTAAPLRAAQGKKRILLVEDEEAQRISLKNGLERLGYKVTAAADGGAALAAFQKKPADFDLVITDQIMPNMSGLELAEALVKSGSDIPVILCTGFSEKVSGGTVGQHGVREVVMKPFALQEISRAIRAVLPKGDGAGAD